MAKTDVRRGPGFAAHFAFLGNFGGFLFPLGAIVLLLVPAVWFYQARQWLDTGTWPPVSVADGLHWAGLTLPHFSFAGGALTSERVMSYPLSLVILAVVGVPLIAYAQFSQWLEKHCEPDDTPLA